jgi:WhiB family transcriptional regulator, redox-sensing transcriptional regulator
MLRGACRGADTGLFFPIATAGRALQQVSSAEAVYVRCIVRPSCLPYALATMQHGIRGGTTGDESMAVRAAGWPAMSRPAGQRRYRGRN